MISLSGFPFLLWPHAAAAKSHQSCLTLCDPIDGSPPGSPVPEILQARTLEWVAISFSNAWKWKVEVKLLTRVWLLATHGLQPTRLLRPWDFPGKSTGVGCIAFSVGHMGQEQKQGLRLQQLASLFPAYWAQTPLPIWLFFQLLIPALPLTSWGALSKTLLCVGYEFPSL